MVGRSRLLVVAAAAALVAARRPIARLARAIDQRGGIFAPRGARFYNAVAPRILRPLYERAADDVVAALRGIEAPAVVEVGSGPGELAIAIARRLTDASVTGVDRAPAMVAEAEARVEAAALRERVRFVVADAEALPLPDASVDLFVSSLSMHHWARVPAVFGELARTLRSGGVALIYDLRPFAYSRTELEGFVAGSGFDGQRLERDLVPLGPLPAAFVRVRLIRT